MCKLFYPCPWLADLFPADLQCRMWTRIIQVARTLPQNTSLNSIVHSSTKNALQRMYQQQLCCQQAHKHPCQCGYQCGYQYDWLGTWQQLHVSYPKVCKTMFTCNPHCRTTKLQCPITVSCYVILYSRTQICKTTNFAQTIQVRVQKETLQLQLSWLDNSTSNFMYRCQLASPKPRTNGDLTPLEPEPKGLWPIGR